MNRSASGRATPVEGVRSGRTTPLGSRPPLPPQTPAYSFADPTSPRESLSAVSFARSATPSSTGAPQRARRNQEAETKLWQAPQLELGRGDDFYAFARGATVVALTNVGMGAGDVQQTFNVGGAAKAGARTGRRPAAAVSERSA